MKVISYCIWNQNPRYLIGLQRNLEMLGSIYPGWQAIVYVGFDISDEQLKIWSETSSVAVNFIKTDIADHRLMLYRFKAISEPGVTVMLSRDADSRLSKCEAACVQEWLESSLGTHIIRCHPHHSVPILGGLWGTKKDAIPGFERLLANWPGEPRIQTDQEFLAQKVWPLVRYNNLTHDEFFNHIWGGKQYPIPFDGCHFMGATVNADETYVAEQVAVLKPFLRK